MKIGIVSYSFTGNNDKLAKTLAKEINAQHVKIENIGEATVKSITLDLIFHRKIENNIAPEIIEKFDFIIYIAPFWIGKIARPLLPFFKYHRKLNIEYSFITVSGGALGKNTKYNKELERRIRKEPLFTKEFYTADLVNKEDAKIKDTSTYLIHEDEINQMKKDIIAKLQEFNIVKRNENS